MRHKTFLFINVDICLVYSSVVIVWLSNHLDIACSGSHSGDYRQRQLNRIHCTALKLIYFNPESVKKITLPIIGQVLTAGSTNQPDRRSNPNAVQMAAGHSSELLIYLLLRQHADNSCNPTAVAHFMDILRFKGPVCRMESQQ